MAAAPRESVRGGLGSGLAHYAILSVAVRAVRWDRVRRPVPSRKHYSARVQRCREKIPTGRHAHIPLRFFGRPGTPWPQYGENTGGVRKATQVEVRAMQAADMSPLLR